MDYSRSTQPFGETVRAHGDRISTPRPWQTASRVYDTTTSTAASTVATATADSYRSGCSEGVSSHLCGRCTTIRRPHHEPRVGRPPRGLCDVQQLRGTVVFHGVVGRSQILRKLRPSTCCAVANRNVGTTTASPLPTAHVGRRHHARRCHARDGYSCTQTILHRCTQGASTHERAARFHQARFDYGECHVPCDCRHAVSPTATPRFNHTRIDRRTALSTDVCRRPNAAKTC